MSLECRCCGLHGHEPNCPIRLGHDWCEDCGHTRCTCITVYRWPDGTLHNQPWLDPSLYQPERTAS
ncbi:hypothetical protein SAMN04488550_4178 [Gordonia malaquae]|nr:hypothetical protein SAMN04488550_4178 [Gordonia malaquae]